MQLSRQRNGFIHEEDGDVLSHGIEIFSIGADEASGDLFIQNASGTIVEAAGGHLLIQFFQDWRRGQLEFLVGLGTAKDVQEFEVKRRNLGRCGGQAR